MLTCIIKELLYKPFSAHSFSEKKEIIKNGRPTPELPNLVQKTSKFTRHFQCNMYTKCDWLAGSAELNAMFCWYCLLFGKDRNTSWTKTGYTHLGNLIKSIAEHGLSVNHLRSSVAISAFGEIRTEIALDDQFKSKISLHNDKVRRNREILKRLISAICFLGKQELVFQGHLENADSINQGNYVELLKFTAEYDPLLADHLEASSVFEEIFNGIQNDLIQAIGLIVLSAIKREIVDAPFIAIMVHETVDMPNKAQVSIVLRYVYEGEIKERFLGFCDISGDKHAQAIAELIQHFLSEFGCNGKLIAQTFESVATLVKNLNEVQALIKVKHPEALFFHSYAHVLNTVLSQSTSQIPDCKIFFSLLNRLAAFLSRSPKSVEFLDTLLQCHLPHVFPMQWNCSSRLVNTVCRNRTKLCDVFNAMLGQPQEIKSDVLASANGFLSLLEDFKFVFLLNTFDKIFIFTDVLQSILQNQASNILYCQKKIQETRHSIATLRDDYEQVFQETVFQVGELSEKKTVNYKHIYCQVFDNIDNHLDVRFQDYSKLKFLNLLSHENYGQYSNQFPESSFQSLIDAYGKFFDIIRLKNELIVVYSTEEFRNKTKSELAKLLSVSSVLNKSFQQFNMLVSLLYTIPMSTFSAENSFSALQRIKSCFRNSNGEERFSHLGIILIEAHLLGELRKKEQFFEEVVTKFASQERRMEFQFHDLPEMTCQSIKGEFNPLLTLTSLSAQDLNVSC